ncbi:MAG: hypothetical protein VB047_09320 [Anaerotignum propionicum]|uniref:hypothetical protein n=1 Tax=Anaerotignum propionicum TaxID=28446 RepID=UPI002B2150E1|nr:hypothetical protein [Anaerotignum propionicum]MEA5057739.1 hypothetical protein [Anaerotignum propionicum]
MQASTQAAVIHISDHTAQQIVDMAKKFYSDEKNVKRFEEWHLKTYGCLPD